MIVSALIGLVLSMINVVLGLFPVGVLPVQFSSAFSWAQTYINQANAFFPVGDIILALKFFIVVELAIFAVKIFLVIWKMLRG